MLRTRLIAMGLALGIASVGLSPSRPAQGAVGVPFAPVALSVLGGVLVANIIHGAVRLSDTLNLEASQFIIFGSVSAGIGFILGVVFLDAQSQELGFRPLTSGATHLAGLTQPEQAAYEDELEEINAWASEAARAVSQAYSRGARSPEDLLQVSGQSWRSAFEQGYLSHHAFSAVRKIVGRALSQYHGE